MNDKLPVCNYEGSDYRTRFWEKPDRDYEDQVERVALRRLMPPTGGRLLDVGAGFGRLADEYIGYQQVVLLDYSRSLLCEGREQLSSDPRYLFVAANWYAMPFIDGVFDTLVQVRTLHHAADAPALLQQLARIIRPRGTYILEFANKHNLKAMARYALRKQTWSPFTLEPVEFVSLNFDFHPDWINAQLRAAGFHPGETLTVSHFRLPLAKRLVPTSLLVAVDKAIQSTGRWWQLTPSVFVHNQGPEEGVSAETDAIFACPTCRTPLDHVPHPDLVNAELPCSSCASIWQLTDGIYNFKEPK